MEKDDGKTGSLVAVGDGDAVDLGVHGFSLSPLFVTLALAMVKGTFALMMAGVYNLGRS